MCIFLKLLASELSWSLEIVSGWMDSSPFSLACELYRTSALAKILLWQYAKTMNTLICKILITCTKFLLLVHGQDNVFKHVEFRNYCAFKSFLRTDIITWIYLLSPSIWCSTLILELLHKIIFNYKIYISFNSANIWWGSYYL